MNIRPWLVTLMAAGLLLLAASDVARAQTSDCPYGSEDADVIGCQFTDYRFNLWWGDGSSTPSRGALLLVRNDK